MNRLTKAVEKFLGHDGLTPSTLGEFVREAQEALIEERKRQEEVLKGLALLPEPTQGLGVHRWAYSSQDMLSFRAEGIQAYIAQRAGAGAATRQDAGGMPYTVDPGVFWRYDDAPRGSKVFLLTKGGIAVEGVWTEDGRYIAWHPLFKRNRELEQERGING